jgi:hypothetical protein
MSVGDARAFVGVGQPERLQTENMSFAVNSLCPDPA